MKFIMCDPRDIDAQRWIRWMDAEVFPEDIPVTFVGSHWWIGWDNKTPACYASWRPHNVTTKLNPLHHTSHYGFLYRAGVLPEYRGKGFQKELLKLREDHIKTFGLTKAVTYTDPQSAASMCSLIACGYRPYIPTPETNLAEKGRDKKFVHWQKELK